MTASPPVWSFATHTSATAAARRRSQPCGVRQRRQRHAVLCALREDSDRHSVPATAGWWPHTAACSVATALAVCLSTCSPALSAAPPSVNTSSYAPVHRVALPKPPLTTEEKQTVNLFAGSRPAVVFITSLVEGRDALTLDPVQAPAGAGSGFIWDVDPVSGTKAHVVTNYHVVKDSSTVKVTFLDTTTAIARVLGFSDDKDIAVLELVDAPQLKAIKPLPLGKSSDLEVGQRVFAIGNPFGLDHTLTTGIVSGIGREIQSGITGRPITGAVQTDAAINPGNSGGPLLNSAGQVVGINTAIYSSSGTSSGVGFALPSDTVASVVDQIIATGRVPRPVLGISFAPDAVSTQLGLGGVLILDVRPDGPAALAGLHGTTRDKETGRLQLGDVIVKVDDAVIKTSSDLYRSLDKFGVGDTLRLSIERATDAPVEVAVTLVDRDTLAPERDVILKAPPSQGPPGDEDNSPP